MLRKGILLLLWVSLILVARGSCQENATEKSTFSPKVLETVRVEALKEGVRLSFEFNEVPVYTVSPLKGGRGISVEFSKTQLKDTGWISSVRKTLIEGVDIVSEENLLKMKFFVSEPVVFSTSLNRTSVIIELKKEVSKKVVVKKVKKKAKPKKKLARKKVAKRKVKKRSKRSYGIVAGKKTKLPLVEAVEIPLSRTRYEGRRISVEFQDADIRSVLTVLGRIGGKSVIIGGDVNGTVTLDVRNIPWDLAFDLVLASNELAKIETGNTIRVVKLSSLEKEVTAVEKLRESLFKLGEKVIFIKPKYVSVVHLSSKLKDLVDQYRGTLVFDEIANVLILKCNPKCVEVARAVSRKLDVPRIEVEFFQLKSGDPKRIISVVKRELSKDGSLHYDSTTETLIVKDRSNVIERIRKIIKNMDITQVTVANFKLGYSRSDVVAKLLSDMFRGQDVKDQDVKITFDRKTNQIFVKASPKVMNQIKKVIRKLDLSIRQVLIEARIVEIEESYTRRLGIKWSGAGWRVGENTFFGVAPGTSPSALSVQGANTFQGPQLSFDINPGVLIDLGVTGVTQLGFVFGYISDISGALLDAQLSALESEGVARVISTPKIITRNNLSAEIKQGFKIPYLRQTEAGIATDFIDAGLILKVTPFITQDNKIGLEVEIEKSTPDFGRQVNGVPTIITRYAKTHVMVKNGETFVIGGIMQKDTSRTKTAVPLLSKIPVLGLLFKSKEKGYSKSELMVFITPKIVASDIDLENL